jgi:stage III sporulation protein AA
METFAYIILGGGRMKNKDELMKILPVELRVHIEKLNLNYEKLQEIRLRVNRPLILVYDNNELIMNNQVIATQRLFNELMQYLSNYSLYAFEEELKQGYITIQGGHRVGLAGRVVIEDSKIKTVKNISFVNIRLASEVLGCANDVLPTLIEKDRVKHTIIISPPRCGKTTLLRDIVRQLSNGTKGIRPRSVGLVDERSEIAACYMGVPQNDIGKRTDVLDCCPKAEGMLMLIRSMSPEVIVVDEIGKKEDIEAIRYVISSGCSVICTVHGSDIERLSEKEVLRDMLSEGVFEQAIILSNQRKIGEIIGITSLVK